MRRRRSFTHGEKTANQSKEMRQFRSLAQFLMRASVLCAVALLILLEEFSLTFDRFDWHWYCPHVRSPLRAFLFQHALATSDSLFAAFFSRLSAGDRWRKCKPHGSWSVGIKNDLWMLGFRFFSICAFQPVSL
jgi:hypothetical protein